MISTLRKFTAIALLGLAVVCFFHGPRDEGDLYLRGLTNQEEIDSLLGEAGGNVTQYWAKHKPVMHTFFEDFKGSDPMLDAWKYEWEKAGWRTKVLTLDDAKEHPYFETMEEAVVKDFKTDEYNQLCFYRYLAMAVDGGGWMSDYDTFPTNFPMEEAIVLPNDEKFTSFQAHVPALISASADEWFRVASLMTEKLPHSQIDFKSDMLILKELGDEGTHDLRFETPSHNVHAYLEYEHKGVVDCKSMAIGRAIHVSHFGEAKSKKMSTYPTEAMEGVPDNEKRPKLARLFLDEWREQCGGSNVATHR